MTATNQIPSLGTAAAAPAMKRVLAQARFETTALLRNGEQLMVSILMPLGVLFVLGATKIIELDTEGAPQIDFVLPGVIAMAIMASSFTSQAIATGFDRRNGVLRFLSTTPLGRGGLLGAKVLSVLSVAAIQIVLVIGVGVALGWSFDASIIARALPAMILGVATFTAFALLIAGTLRAEGVIALANIILVLLLVGGGVLAPTSHLPAWLAPIAQFLPSGALGDALRAAFVDHVFALAPLAVLAAWAVVLTAATGRLFKWH